MENNCDSGGGDYGFRHAGGGHGRDRGNEVVFAAIQLGTLGRLCPRLGLAVPPMGVSAVASQGAGREPYRRQEGARTHYGHCRWQTEEKGTRELWVMELDL